MKELPNEIWVLILSYLPPRYLQRLYPVNRLFFNIALNVRYQEVCLRGGNSRQPLGKDMQVFLNPLLCSRPTTLQIRLSSLIKWFQRKEEPERRSVLKRIFQSIMNRGKPNAPSISITTVLDIMPKLTGVMNLKIVFDFEPPSDDTATLVLAEAWKIFGDRLWSLSIDSSKANLGMLLTTLHLPSLEKFSIQLSIFPRSTDANAVVDATLIPFLIRHQSSLRQISITTMPHYNLEISSILQCLRDVPCLHSIGIGLPFSLDPVEMAPFNGRRMLLAHQQNLKSFALYFPKFSASVNLSSFFSQDWSRVQLPNLRELIVQLPNMTRCKEFFDYIQSFASSLVTLTISGYQFSYKGVEKLSRRLADFRSLRYLTLSTRGLSPSILAAFAQTIPWLSHLGISHHYFFVNENEPRFEHELPSLFSRSMQSYVAIFSQWKLESFDFGADMSARSNARIKEILVQRLPNVMWFCQVEREECIRMLQQLRFIITDPTPTLLPRTMI